MSTVEIRRNETGETRKYEYEYPWDGDYIWTDGNYSCDCNRRLFFGYAAGEKGEDIETECGKGAFSIRIWDAGEIVYDEFGSANITSSREDV